MICDANDEEIDALSQHVQMRKPDAYLLLQKCRKLREERACRDADVHSRIKVRELRDRGREITFDIQRPSASILALQYVCSPSTVEVMSSL